MEKILDIPKIYTANAEWMACLTVILVYRRSLSPGRWNFLRISGVMALSYLLIRLIQYYCQQHDSFVWLIAMMCAVFVMIATIRFTLMVRWSVAFYTGARAFMWAELAAALEWQVYHYYTFGRNEMRSAHFGMAASLISYVLLYGIFYLVERHQLPKDISASKLTVTRANVIFAWVITGLLFGLSNLSYLVPNTPFSGTGIANIFNVRTLFDVVGVVVGQMFHLQKQDMERRAENTAFETILRNQYIQFRESKENIDMINRKYHDLKHQLQILRETTGEAERSSYIDEIQEGIEKYEAENKTGNDVLDTVLTSKHSRCLKENVTMTVVADGTLVDRMSVMDICAIFGNALDNAIEYEMKVADPEKRLIHLTVSERNGFVCILVENYYEGQTIRDGTFPESTKQNRKYHGFGLKSIQYTVEKYGGYLHTGVRGNWFRLEMIIPKE